MAHIGIKIKTFNRGFREGIGYSPKLFGCFPNLQHKDFSEIERMQFLIDANLLKINSSL
jgi:hypothetical protein